MRRAQRIIMALMSCCFLCFNQGCGTQETDSSHDAKTSAQDQAAPDSEGEAEDHLPTDQAPTVDVTPPTGGPAVPVPVPVPIPGGGGSQGHLDPARTGNPDNDPRVKPELDCVNDKDDDQDGDTDCEDSDCIGKTCENNDGCDVNETCQRDGSCVGEERSCSDDNECTTDECIDGDGGPNDFECENDFDDTKDEFSSCTPSDPENCSERNPDFTCDEENVIDECIVGRCVLRDGEAVCLTSNLGVLTPDEVEGGCEDGNPCIANMCKDEGDETVCMPTILNGLRCDDGNDCTFMDRCEGTECTGMDVPDPDEGPGIDDSCDPDNPNSCGDKAFCVDAGLCSDASSRAGELCYDDDHCPGGDCELDDLSFVCVCDDERSCTGIDRCEEGGCVADDLPAECTDDASCFGADCVDNDGTLQCVCEGEGGNECADGFCGEGGECVPTDNEGDECDDDNDCTEGETCNANNECTGGDTVPPDEVDETVCPQENECTECICAETAEGPACSCDTVDACNGDLLSLEEALDLDSQVDFIEATISALLTAELDALAPLLTTPQIQAIIDAIIDEEFLNALESAISGVLEVECLIGVTVCEAAAVCVLPEDGGLVDACVTADAAVAFLNDQCEFTVADTITIDLADIIDVLDDNPLDPVVIAILAILQPLGVDITLTEEEILLAIAADVCAEL